MVGRIVIPIAEAARSITVEVHLKGLKIFKARLWLATLFIKLGVWIADMNYEED